MASPYILGDEEEDYYDDYYDTYGGPDVFGGDEFFPVQVPEEISGGGGGYVRAGADRPSYFWEDQYAAEPARGAGLPSAIPAAYVGSGGAGPVQFWEDQYEYEPRGISPEEAARASYIPPPGIWDPAAGLIPFSEAALNPEEVEALMERMFSPFLSQEDREALEAGPLTPSPLAKTTSGLMQAGLGTAESLTSPVNLALLGGTAGLSGLPVVPRVLSGAFAADMARHVPELAQELGRAYESGDEEAIARAAGNLGATGAFTTVAGLHAGRPRITVPEQFRTQPTGEQRYALREQEAGAPYGRLPEQPRIDEALPTQEGRGGIPSEGVPPGDAASRLRTEAAGGREVSLTDLETLTKQPVPKDPVERSNFETELLDRGQVYNQEQGLPAGTRSVSVDEPWVATVDEAGNVVVNRRRFGPWLEKVKPADRLKAVQSLFSEEGIHGVARKVIPDAEIGELWKSLTGPERALLEKSYGQLDPSAIEQGVPREVLYGHEYLRRQMQRMLREPVREKAEASGYQWLKETSIDAIERVIIAVRRAVGSKASKALDGMLGRMQEHIDAARTAKGMPTRQVAEAATAAAPRAMEKGGEAEREPPPLIPAMQGKSFPEVVDIYSKGPADAGTGYQGKFANNPTGLAWDIGSMAKTPEDVALLRKLAEDNAAKAKELMQAGDFDAAMQLAGKQPAEAYEFATGVTIDGKPKWTTFEQRLPGYRPPVPDPQYTAAKGAKPELPPVEKGAQAEAFESSVKSAPTARLEEQAAQLRFHLEQLKSGLRAEGVTREMEQRWGTDWKRQLDFINAELGRRGGGAGTAGAPRAMPQSPDLQSHRDVVARVREFFGGLPGRLRALPNRLAGQDAPVTYTASPESANKLVEYASANIAAPEVARSMASEVLGDKWADTEFGRRLGAVLVEDRLRGIMDERRNAGDPNWNDVTTMIGHANSPFRTEADFRRALADPEIRAAIGRHKQTVQRVAQAQHQLARGQLAGVGRHTGAFVNLEAVLPDAPEGGFGAGGRGNLMNPLRRASRFSRRAKGTAEEYQMDYRRMSERMIQANFNEAAKRRMYGQLIRDGLAVMTDPGKPIPAGFEAHPTPFTIERRGTPMGGGKARTFVKYLWVKKNIYPEVRQALNVDGRVGEAAIINAANALNQIQLAGPTDAVWHIANMVGSIAGSQGGRNVLIDVVRKIPGVNLMDALGRTAASSIKVLRDTPDVQKQIGELAKIGAMRAQEGKGVVPLGQKRALLRLLHPGNLIQLLDRGGRVVRDDLYKNMVRRGLVADTPANRRLWVNQMGQYNARLMGQLQRYFKEWGFSPFVVAGRNFNRMAMRRMVLSQGVKARNPAAAAQMKAVDALGMISTLVVVPSVLNYFITGSPSGRPGTKFGQIDTGQDTKDGKHLVIDPGQWSGIRRGMRITGAQGLIEGLREGQRGKRITAQMASDIVGGAIHPWTGPAVHGASVLATGYSPSGYKESENPKDFGANALAALEQLNPIAKAIVEGHKERRGAAAQVGLSLGGAVGLKAVRPLTAYDRVRNIHEKWLADNPDPKIRQSFERSEAATFPLSQYRDLDKFIRNKDKEAMMESLQKVREVALDKDILKRMMPVIGSGINQRPKPLFHASAQSEAQFRLSLTDKQLEEYQQALEDRKERFQLFLEVWRERGPRPEVIEQETETVPTPNQ